MHEICVAAQLLEDRQNGRARRQAGAQQKGSLYAKVLLACDNNLRPN